MKSHRTGPSLLAGTCAGLLLLGAAGCKPSVDSRDADKRERAARAPEMTDQAVLARLALEDPSYSVRREAVEKLNDQSVLARVAQTDDLEYVRTAAVQRLNDQQILADITLHNTERAIQEAAARRLVDQRQIAAVIAEAPPSSQVFRIVFPKVQDQTLLGTFALQGKDDWVRLQAIEHLTDQDQLATVAGGGVLPAERTAAARRWHPPRQTDQSVFGRVACYGSESQVRWAALARLTDRDWLARVAAESVDEGIRQAAANPQRKPPSPEDSLAETKDPAMRRRLLRTVTDGSLLKQVALHDPNSSLRQQAFLALRDQNLLAELAENTEDWMMRDRALRRITDPAVWLRIALSNEFPRLRPRAIARLDDPAVLRQLAEQNPTSSWIPRACRERLRQLEIEAITDPQALATLYLENRGSLSDSSEFRNFVLNQIRDPDALSRLAKDPRAAAWEIDTRRKRLWIETIGPETDKNALKRLFWEEENIDLPLLAVARITEPEMLVHVATHARSPEVRSLAVAKITDQSLLGQVARENLQAYSAETLQDCVERIDDQKVLRDLVTEVISRRLDLACEIVFQRLQAPALIHELIRKHANQDIMILPLVSRVEDRGLLAELALTNPFPEIREAATPRIEDQTVLLTIARKDESRIVRQAAIARLNDPAVLHTLAQQDASTECRLAATERLLEYPEKLAELAVAGDAAVQSMALLGITDEKFLGGLIRRTRNPQHRVRILLLLSDPDLLHQAARTETAAAARRAAVAGLNDDAFLLERAEIDPSPAVRRAICGSFRTPEALLRAASTGYFEDVRQQAALRLASCRRPELTAAAAQARLTLEAQVRQLARPESAPSLVATALTGPFDVLRRAAATALQNSEDIKRVASQSTDRDVLKIVFAKLRDPAVLDALVTAAADPALRLATAQKTGRHSWKSVFAEAMAAPGPAKPQGSQLAHAPDGTAPQDAYQPRDDSLGDALAAVALFGTEQPDARKPVQDAALHLIGKGNESRIPEMIDILSSYGDRTLCEDYMNCGQPDLNEAGITWAKARGYMIMIGQGSNRAKWGLGK